MPATSFSVRRQLLIVIKRFKFEELETCVLPLFPETSWARVKSKLVKQHENFSVGNAAKLIEGEIDKNGVSVNVLKERLSILEVIDVSRHHDKKTWHCYELKGSNTEMDFMTRRDLENRIIEHCRVYEMPVEVQTASSDGITFAAIKEKPKKGRRVRVTPVFFALLLGQKYFFCSKKGVASYFIKAVAHTMGHNSSKRVKLVGRDLHSLITFIWQKKQGAIDAKTVQAPYQDSKPVIRSTGIDFTQAHNRKEYMDQIFGKDPPTLESLALDSTGQPWIVEGCPSLKLPQKPFPLAWDYKSPRVASFIQNLAERNVLVTPVPFYLSQWMTIGKNHLVLQEN